MNFLLGFKSVQEMLNYPADSLRFSASKRFVIFPEKLWIDDFIYKTCPYGFTLAISNSVCQFTLQTTTWSLNIQNWLIKVLRLSICFHPWVRSWSIFANALLSLFAALKWILSLAGLQYSSSCHHAVVTNQVNAQFTLANTFLQ